MTTENDDDDINVRIIIDSDIFDANNSVNLERLYMRHFIDTFIDELYEYEDEYEDESDENNRELQYALQESEEMYKYLEKKNVSLDIKTEKFEKVKNKNDDNECCICKDEFEIDSEVTTLECGHLLHSKCIEEWAKYQAKCPICRNELKIKNI